MRYLPLDNIKNGMILGQDLYSGDGRLLLAKYQTLTDEYIDGLRVQEIPGVYIDDEFTRDIHIREVIRPEVKREALNLINKMFLSEEKDDKAAVPQKRIDELVISIVDNVLSNKDVMSNMMDIKTYDDYTYFHSVNVGVLAAIIGVGCKLSIQELESLTTAAMLHDVGKRFIDEKILNLPRKLTNEEMKIVMQHPKLGYEFLKKSYDFAPDVYVSVLEHHEWYNGGGYPLRKAKDEIPMYARIIKLVDVYDALTSKRPYHEPMSPSDAVEYVMALNGAEFDPRIVEVFLRKIAVYPIGCEVELSDGRSAVVMENYSDFVLRPKVKICDSEEIINLKDDAAARSLTIINMNV